MLSQSARERYRKVAWAVRDRMGRCISAKRFDWAVNDYCNFAKGGLARDKPLNPFEAAAAFRTFQGRPPEGSRFRYIQPYKLK